MKRILIIGLLLVIFGCNPPDPPDPEVSFFDIPSAGAIKPDFNISSFIDDVGKQWVYWCSNLEWHAEVFLNIKNTDGTWEYPDSIKIISQSEFPMFGNDHGSVAMGDVLYSNTAIFKNPDDLHYYKYVMYLVYQPEVSNTAGAIYVSFSDNGVDWTFMQHATYPEAPCNPYYDNAPIIPVEAVGAIFDGTTIYIIEIEGHLEKISSQNISQTLTYFATANINNPTLFNIECMLPSTGMFIPNKASFGPGYCWYINLGIAYDNINNYLYIGRGYPYGVDLSGETAYPTSCQSHCISGIATYPVRVQVYRMPLDSLDHIDAIQNGTWELIVDLGNKTGYQYKSEWDCIPLELQAAQNSVNMDMETVSFLRTQQGYLHPKKIAYFATAKDNINMTQGEWLYGNDPYMGIYEYNLIINPDEIVEPKEPEEETINYIQRKSANVSSIEEEEFHDLYDKTIDMIVKPDIDLNDDLYEQANELANQAQVIADELFCGKTGDVQRLITILTKDYGELYLSVRAKR